MYIQINGFNLQTRKLQRLHLKNNNLGLICGTNDKTLKKYNPRCQKTVGFKFIKSDDSGPKLGTYKRLCYKVMTCKIINNVGWPCRRKLYRAHTYSYTYTCTCMQICISKIHKTNNMPIIID